MNSLKHTPGQASGAGEDTEGHREAADPATGVAQEDLGPRETTGTVPRLHVATVAHGPTEQEKNAELQAKSACTVVDLDTSQKCANKS